MSPEELSDEEWRLFVAQGLADELNDARQDLYSMDDGKPIDESR